MEILTVAMIFQMNENVIVSKYSSNKLTQKNTYISHNMHDLNDGIFAIILHFIGQNSICTLTLAKW